MVSELVQARRVAPDGTMTSYTVEEPCSIGRLVHELGRGNVVHVQATKLKRAVHTGAWYVLVAMTRDSTAPLVYPPRSTIPRDIAGTCYAMICTQAHKVLYIVR